MLIEQFVRMAASVDFSTELINACINPLSVWAKIYATNIPKIARVEWGMIEAELGMIEVSLWWNLLINLSNT